MVKKLTTISVLFFLLLLAACGGDDNNATDGNESISSESSAKKEISILMGKPEVAKQFEAMIKEYNDTHENVEATIIPLAGQNAYEKMTSLYAAGNAPTIIMMGKEYPEFKDNLLDLSDQPWVEHAQTGTLDFVEEDGKYLGMPVTVEGFGYIYNKSVIEEAVGGKFDPTTINTQDRLEQLLEDISALEGKNGIHITQESWSLGAHFSNIFATNQSADRNERHQFLEDLKNGDVNLMENDVFNGWVDIFDLMKEHNSHSADPLAPTFDDGTLALANGDVGLWFMGNWSYPQLKEINDSEEFGFIPVPISNDSSDYGNNEISIGVPSYWVVDASQSTSEEQKAATDLLNWMIDSETGQDYYVNQLSFIPVFDNFEVQPEDSLSLDMIKYMDSESTLEWMNSYYPADASAAMGASIQKYLADVIDREELASELEDYWQKAK